MGLSSLVILLANLLTFQLAVTLRQGSGLPLQESHRAYCTLTLRRRLISWPVLLWEWRRGCHSRWRNPRRHPSRTRRLRLRLDRRRCQLCYLRNARCKWRRLLRTGRGTPAGSRFPADSRLSRRTLPFTRPPRRSRIVPVHMNRLRVFYRLMEWARSDIGRHAFRPAQSVAAYEHSRGTATREPRSGSSR